MKINLKIEGNMGFQSLLYYLFILKKRYRVDAIAKEMRIATDTLYRYIRGEHVIPPDRIVDLIKATGEIEFLEFFCEPAGYVPVKVQGEFGNEQNGGLQVQILVAIADIFRRLDASSNNGGPSKEDCKEIDKAINRLIGKILELKEGLKNGKG